MRIDLETIKKIEYYLTDNMSITERKLFEQEMSGNNELKNAVNQQKDLTLAMEKISIKSVAVNAGIKYRRNLIIKYVAGVCTVVLVVVGSYFIYDGLNNATSTKENALIENIAPKGESSPVQFTETFNSDSLPSTQSLSAITVDNSKVFRGEKNIEIKDSVSDNKKIHLVGGSNVDSTKTQSNKTQVQNDQQIITHVKGDSLQNDLNLLVDNDKIFHHFTKESEFFTVSTNRDIKIKGIEGTKITIPQGSLVDSTGKPVTGSVKIQLMEFYKKSDVIFADLHTQSDDKILESAGTIYISITQENEEVFLAPDKTISIQFTNKVAKDSMLLFNGITTNGKLDWKLNRLYETQLDTFYGKTKTKNVGGVMFSKKHHIRKKGKLKNKGIDDEMYIVRSNPGFDNLILQTNQLGWINCDRFRESKNNTTVTVKYEVAYTPVVRLVFQSMNSIMSSNVSTSNETVFSNIPLGTELDIVAFAMVNDVPYYFSKRIKVTKDHVEQIELYKTTLDELENSIRSLDKPRKSHDFRIMN